MNDLRGTGAIVRLVVARDRVRLLVWIACVVVLVIASAASTKGIYPTQNDLDAAAAVAIDNPAALAFNGPAQALDTMGGQIAFQIGAFGFLVVGLMSVLLVGRLTRGEEESGRLELVRSMPVGRHAPLAAGLAVVLVAQALLGALTALSLLASDLPAIGSIVFGMAFASFGVAFAGITAVAAQVSENPRVTGGAAGAVLGVAFALRAVGDIGEGTLSWLSPMGWAQRSRPYAGERWWPLAMLVVLGGGLIWLAAALAARRDFGAGMVAPKPGPARAATSLGSSLGLAVRMGRAAVFWWSVSTLALGLVYGSLIDAIADFVSDNEALIEIVAGYGEASLIESYVATSLLVIALLAVGPALQLAVRLHTEEAELRAEPLLATPTSRAAWMASHIVSALLGSMVALALGGAGLGLAYAVSGGGAGQVPRLVGAALAYAPAVAVLTSVTIALFGFAPRWTAGGWVALAGCFVIAMFGRLLDLPNWIMDLSPFQHTPAVPADALRVVPLAVLTVLAAVLFAFGFRAFHGRDIATS